MDIVFFALLLGFSYFLPWWYRRREAWIQTFTGKHFYVFAPRLEDISVRDIAHHLAHTCRFNRACSRFYSVAEHSVHVSRRVPHHYALAALFHDVDEAYTADVPTPVKPFFFGYKSVAKKIKRRVFEALSLDLERAEHCLVKSADQDLLATEWKYLMVEGYHRPPGRVIPDLDLSEPMLPHAAEEAFLLRYYELTGIDLRENESEVRRDFQTHLRRSQCPGRFRVGRRLG